jgi:hypothetical protein
MGKRPLDIKKQTDHPVLRVRGGKRTGRQGQFRVLRAVQEYTPTKADKMGGRSFAEIFWETCAGNPCGGVAGARCGGWWPYPEVLLSLLSSS